MIRIRSFQWADEQAVVELWQRCGLVRPWNDPHRDIARKMSTQGELFLVGLLGDVIVATVMAGYDGHRGWINYLAVDPSHRKLGYGKQLMHEAERLLRVMECPKINLQVRAGNADALEFYRRIGFAVDDVVSMGKRLESDE